MSGTLHDGAWNLECMNVKAASQTVLDKSVINAPMIEKRLLQTSITGVFDGQIYWEREERVTA